MREILLWSVDYILNHSTTNFGRISNIIEIPLVGRAPGCSGNSLQWCHNGRDGVSNHQPRHCLLNRLFRLRSKKTSKPRITGLCARWPVNSPHKEPVIRKMFLFDDVIMYRDSLWKSKLNSRKITFFYIRISCSFVLKFCTEHAVSLMFSV